MDPHGVDDIQILVGMDGYARIYMENGGNAVAWSEVLITKDKMEAAWRNYLRAGD